MRTTDEGERLARIESTRAMGVSSWVKRIHRSDVIGRKENFCKNGTAWFRVEVGAGLLAGQVM